MTFDVAVLSEWTTLSPSPRSEDEGEDFITDTFSEALRDGDFGTPNYSDQDGENIPPSPGICMRYICTDSSTFVEAIAADSRFFVIFDKDKPAGSNPGASEVAALIAWMVGAGATGSEVSAIVTTSNTRQQNRDTIRSWINAKPKQ